MFYDLKIAIFGFCQMLSLCHLVITVTYSSIRGFATGGITDLYPQRPVDKVIPENISMYLCFIKCERNIKCMSLFTNAGQCHLYYSGFVDNTVLLQEPGWKFYNIYTDGCPITDGYIQSRQLGLCYKLHLGGVRNSYDFMSTCQSEGGELLRITSQEIQDHIADFLTDATYHFPILIQGSDRNSEGTFTFEDGTELSYFNWYITEPNNRLGDEDFIFLMPNEGFRWIDSVDVATAVTSFICEIAIV